MLKESLNVECFSMPSNIELVCLVLLFRYVMTNDASSGVGRQVTKLLQSWDSTGTFDQKSCLVRSLVRRLGPGPD
jgi:hypothetical protein